MSRRRRKNPLLGRILLVSVIVHVIALPVLAKFGAFEKIKRQFVTANVTVAPPPPAEKEKPVERKEAKKQTAKSTKGNSHANKASTAAHSSPHPAVATAAGDGKGGDDGGAIDAGSGKAGQIPKDTGGGSAKTETPSVETPKKELATPTPPVEKPKPTEPKPIEKPIEAKPTPKVPVLVGAEVESQALPEIPDDLRDEATDKTTVVLVAVDESGKVSEASVATSSGSKALDALALGAAKRWRFKPATRDGEPVASHARIHIRFEVETR